MLGTQLCPFCFKLGRSNGSRAFCLCEIAVACSVFWAVTLSLLGVAADWPQFHGPRRDNISHDTGLAAAWPENGPPLLWSASGLGHGFSTVAIAAGRILTTGDRDDRLVITCLDLSGKILWQAENGPAWTGPVPGSRGTPTIDGEFFYHQNAHGDLACFRLDNGQRLWHVNVLQAFGAENIDWALAESPLVDGQKVISCPGGPQTAIVAFDKKTGQLLWKSPSVNDKAGYCSPILAEWQGLRMIMVLTAKGFIGVNADTGALLWYVRHETPFDENITSPIYHNGHVFISTRTTGSVLFRIHVDGQTARLEPVWRNLDLDNQHGGVILYDGHLYGASHVNQQGKWICVDWTTGQTRWMERGVGKGALTLADGKLFLVSETGDVGLAPASPRELKVVSQFKAPRGGPGPFWAHPVVCDGRLYIRHSDRLFVYDVRSPAGKR
ncbi:MAG: PQQ-binding-like beta-propeller repeat protein [Thermoguttaceae bacterium]|nr:PQQ-binding-like beta-propeller repeat protein [Thermoguttaceae bacterium]MDW8079367.1 PQQ-binding-like beta-propeller repeat protein [Thermoguttaceae bacterium]